MELNEKVYDSNFVSDSDNYVESISSETANKLELFNSKVKYGKIPAISMIDSGSICSIITKTLAKNILKTNPTARWVASADETNL